MDLWFRRASQLLGEKSQETFVPIDGEDGNLPLTALRTSKTSNNPSGWGPSAAKTHQRATVSYRCRINFLRRRRPTPDLRLRIHHSFANNNNFSHNQWPNGTPAEFDRFALRREYWFQASLSDDLKETPVSLGTNNVRQRFVVWVVQTSPKHELAFRRSACLQRLALDCHLGPPPPGLFSTIACNGD
jgi:hypothetical protein